MTRLLKRAALLVSIVLVSPLIALAWLDRFSGGSTMFDFGAQGLSLIPGLPGDYLRLGYYSLTLKSIGPDVRMCFGSFFSSRAAEVGNHVNIGAYCILGNVEVGDHVLIASRVSIMSGKYQHGSALVATAVSSDSRVSIGDRSWVGEGAIVAASVGSDCIVAAGGVVMREVPDGHMAAGNPARPMKMDSKAAEGSVPRAAASSVA